MWLFHNAPCQSLVSSSASWRVGFPETATKVIRVFPFLESFKISSGFEESTFK